MARARGGRRRARSRSRWSATPPRSSPRGPRAGERFDVVTDQTSAHDALGGYVPGRDLARRRGGAPRAPSRTSTSARSTALDGRPRPRDARVPGGRRRRLRLRQQPPGAGPGGGRRERVRLPGLRAGVHPAAVLRGPRAVPLGRAVGRPGGHPPHRPRGARAVPRRRRPAALDRDGRGARPVPGPAGAHLLAGLRRARQGRASSSTSWSRRARSSAPIVIGRDHLDAGSVASPNRETEAMARRLRRGRRLAAPQRAGQHRRRRDLGVDPPRRRRGHRLQPARRAWSSSPTAPSSRRRSWSASSRRTRAWASCATWTRATSARSRSPASAASASRCSTRADASG